jgi:hypothetical protein
MMFIEHLCPPAALYLIYIMVHIGLDLGLGMYITAAVKLVSGVVCVLLLDSFCEVDLGIVSWVVISTPFIITALATSIALGLNLDRGLQGLAKEHFSGKKEDLVKSLGPGEPPISTNSSY